jgi:hypothetical protein
VGKSISKGPKIMTLKITLLKIKAMLPEMTIARVALIKCHLNSSKWSKKDILSGVFFAIIICLL